MVKQDNLDTQGRWVIFPKSKEKKAGWLGMKTFGLGYVDFLLQLGLLVELFTLPLPSYC